MRPLDLFVVHLENRVKDTIKTSSGLEIYVDPKFNEFKHRVTEGEVVAAPCKYDTHVEPGDTLYFHHLVVVNDGQPLTGEDDKYLVRCDPDGTINNQAIAYKSKKDGVVRPLFGWCLLEPYEEDKEEISSEIDVVTFKEDPVEKGVVSFDTSDLEELGVHKGDVVGFQKNIDYRITIDGTEYYRIPAERLLYKL